MKTTYMKAKHIQKACDKFGVFDQFKGKHNPDLFKPPVYGYSNYNFSSYGFIKTNYFKSC